METETGSDLISAGWKYDSLGYQGLLAHVIAGFPLAVTLSSLSAQTRDFSFFFVSCETHFHFSHCRCLLRISRLRFHLHVQHYVSSCISSIVNMPPIVLYSVGEDCKCDDKYSPMTRTVLV